MEKNPNYPDMMLGEYKLPDDSQWPDDDSFEGLEPIEPTDEEMEEFLKNKKPVTAAVSCPPATSDIKLNLIKLIGPPLLTRDDHKIIFFK